MPVQIGNVLVSREGYKPKERYRNPYYLTYDRDDRRWYDARYFYSGEQHAFTVQKPVDGPSNTKVNLMNDSTFNECATQDDWSNESINNEQYRVNKQMVRKINKKRQMIDPKQ